MQVTVYSEISNGYDVIMAAMLVVMVLVICYMFFYFVYKD